MKYFYIISRKGLITEVEYSQDRYEKTLKAWESGGILLIKPAGCENPVGLNTADISYVLDKQAYENYISSAQPKMWLQDGIWKDKGGKIRLEPWKQLEVDKVLKLKEAEDEIDPKASKKFLKMMADFHKSKGWA